MIKKFVTVILTIFLTAIIYPQSIQKLKHPFSGRVVISLAGGGAIPLSDYGTPLPKLLGEGGLGYFFDLNSKHTIGLQFFGGEGKIGGKDGVIIPNKFNTSISYLSGGIIYSYFMSERFTPYLFAGAGKFWYVPKDDNGLKLPNSLVNPGDLSEFTYNFRAGIDYFIAKNLSLNFNAGIHLGKNDLLDGFVRSGSKNDAVLTASIGFSFAFSGWGGGGVNDEDGDGVPDDQDKCPGTPPGTKVTIDGCPIDADGDGVPDIEDKCPNTKKGVFVDENGCPVDTDGDGVPDFRDQCADTPNDVSVNMFGCPIDRDGDGVPDYKDKCAGTPEGIKVDENGCPEGFEPITPIIPKTKITFPVKKETRTYIPKTIAPTIFGNYNPNSERNVRGRIWTDGNSYVIQHSSWRTRPKAERIARSLLTKGHNAFVQKAYISKFRRTYYRVRIGYFNSLSEAQSYSRKVR